MPDLGLEMDGSEFGGTKDSHKWARIGREEVNALPALQSALLSRNCLDGPSVRPKRFWGTKNSNKWPRRGGKEVNAFPTL